MKLVFPALFLGAISAFAAGPTITEMTASQDRYTQLVTIEYTLAGANAVITVDVETNKNCWASIGGKNVQGFVGDVNKVVSSGNHVITWQPKSFWPGFKIKDYNTRIVLKAWAENDKPDYMVVDLLPDVEDRVKYYQSEEYLPGGGVLASNIYRTTSLVMRRVRARGIPWSMGGDGEPGMQAGIDESHTVTLTNDYYIGVFPMTQRQWATVTPEVDTWPSYFNNEQYRDMRPVDWVCFNEMRLAALPTAQPPGDVNVTFANVVQYQYPNNPHPNSFLGRIRTLVNNEVDFDLPSEAQWEFACRSGTVSGMWNNGFACTNASYDVNIPGRYVGNSNGSGLVPQNVDLESGTSEVGHYPANGLGIYDMHGNIPEWCIDCWEKNILNLNGAPNTSGGAPLSKEGAPDNYQNVMRGGEYRLAAKNAHSGYRSCAWPATHGTRNNSYFQPHGVRLSSRNGLK